jgi:hypothetical protein
MSPACVRSESSALRASHASELKVPGVVAENGFDRSARQRRSMLPVRLQQLRLVESGALQPGGQVLRERLSAEVGDCAIASVRVIHVLMGVA